MRRSVHEGWRINTVRAFLASCMVFSFTTLAVRLEIQILFASGIKDKRICPYNNLGNLDIVHPLYRNIQNIDILSVFDLPIKLKYSDDILFSFSLHLPG